MNKTKVLALSAAFALTGAALSAQCWGGGYCGGPRGFGGANGGFGSPLQRGTAPDGANGRYAPLSRSAPETVTVSGKLEVLGGEIAVKQDSKTYYISGLRGLVGFIDGLKEGAAVTLEGRASALPRQSGAYLLRADKLTVNGKEYANLSGPRAPGSAG